MPTPVMTEEATPGCPSFLRNGVLLSEAKVAEWGLTPTAGARRFVRSGPRGAGQTPERRIKSKVGDEQILFLRGPFVLLLQLRFCLNCDIKIIKRAICQLRFGREPGTYALSGTDGLLSFFAGTTVLIDPNFSLKSANQHLIGWFGFVPFLEGFSLRKVLADVFFRWSDISERGDLYDVA